MVLTRAQLMLIDGAGEEEWTRFIKSRAHRYGWNGVHQRYSQGAIESIHTLGIDGFCEGLGMPDWLFWHEDLEQAFLAELKGATGTLSKWQKRTNPSLRRAGFIVFEWYPRHAEEAERIFEHGLGDSDVRSAGEFPQAMLGRQLRDRGGRMHARAGRG